MARVLIVDDTDIVRKALQLAVSRMGHDAETAADARRALEIAAENLPALALLDYRMPGIDGLALFSALHESLGDRCPKVIFVSATPADQMQASAPAHLRATAYVKKPFHLDELWKVVDEALKPTS